MVQKGLLPLSKEDREANHPYRVGAVLDLPKLADIPDYFNPGVPESWVLNQVEYDPNNDECGGASAAIVSGMQEGKQLDPHFHWMMARQRAQMKIPDFGVNNRDLAMTLVKVGSLLKEDSPYTFATPRDTIADPTNWNLTELLPKAIQQKKGSVVWITPHQGYDAYDTFRASITKFNKLYQKTHAAVFGMVYNQPSNDPNIEEVTEQGSGHDVALIGWNGDNAIMVNSLGINAGARGMFYINRKVINRWAEEFGMFIPIDATQEDINLAAKSPLKLDDITSRNILTRIYVKLIEAYTNLVELLKKKQSAGYVPPLDWTDRYKARHSARIIMDEYNLSWDEKDLLCACIMQESGFNPRAIGKPNANGTRDYGLCQYNNGRNAKGQAYWIGEGADFKDIEDVLSDPEKNVRIMVREYKRGNLKWWSSFSTGAYKKWL